MPGDGIIDLIEHAWDVRIVEYYLSVMQGRTPETRLPARAARAAAAWFLHPGIGEVVGVEGVEDAGRSPGVLSTTVIVGPGDAVGALRSSWDRVAVVTAGADTVDEAMRAAQRALDKITVKVV